MSVELMGMERRQMEALLAGWKQPPYRGAQLYSAIYRERHREPALISTFPLGLRERLAETARIRLTARSATSCGWATAKRSRPC